MPFPLNPRLLVCLLAEWYLYRYSSESHNSFRFKCYLKSGTPIAMFTRIALVALMMIGMGSGQTQASGSVVNLKYDESGSLERCSQSLRISDNDYSLGLSVEPSSQYELSITRYLGSSKNAVLRPQRLSLFGSDSDEEEAQKVYFEFLGNGEVYEFDIEYAARLDALLSAPESEALRISLDQSFVNTLVDYSDIIRISVEGESGNFEFDVEQPELSIWRDGFKKHCQ